MLGAIALANALTFWVSAPRAARDTGYGAIVDSRVLDQVVIVVAAMGVHVRGLPLFATLFGVGVALVTQALWRRGYPWRRARAVLLRRYGTLGVVGIAHLVLLYRGDIVTIYAACGLLLTFMVGLSTRALRRFALGSFVVSVCGWTAMGALMLALPDASTPRAATIVTAHEASYESYLVGNLVALATTPVLLVVFAASYGCALLVGFLMYREGLVTNPAQHCRALKRWCVAGGIVAVGVGLPWGLGLIGLLPGPLTQALGCLNAGLGVVTGPALLSAILLVARRWEGVHAPAPIGWLAALGRRSLSGYVAQSILFVVLVQPFALALLPASGAAGSAAAAVAIWALTVAGAVMFEWLGWPGPLEWVHRRLAYGRRGCLGECVGLRDAKEAGRAAR